MTIEKLAHNLIGTALETGTRVLHSISDIVTESMESKTEKAVRILKEKGVHDISTDRHFGHVINSLVASGKGDFVTVTNDTNLRRNLLNSVLFADKGELRINEAMSSEKNGSLSRVGVPATKPQTFSATQLAPNKCNSIL